MATSDRKHRSSDSDVENSDPRPPSPSSSLVPPLPPPPPPPLLALLRGFEDAQRASAQANLDARTRLGCLHSIASKFVRLCTSPANIIPILKAAAPSNYVHRILIRIFCESHVLRMPISFQSDANLMPNSIGLGKSHEDHVGAVRKMSSKTIKTFPTVDIALVVQAAHLVP